MLSHSFLYSLTNFILTLSLQSLANLVKRIVLHMNSPKHARKGIIHSRFMENYTNQAEFIREELPGSN